MQLSAVCLTRVCGRQMFQRTVVCVFSFGISFVASSCQVLMCFDATRHWWSLSTACVQDTFWGFRCSSSAPDFMEPKWQEYILDFYNHLYKSQQVVCFAWTSFTPFHFNWIWPKQVWGFSSILSSPVKHLTYCVGVWNSEMIDLNLNNLNWTEEWFHGGVWCGLKGCWPILKSEVLSELSLNSCIVFVQVCLAIIVWRQIKDKSFANLKMKL